MRERLQLRVISVERNGFGMTRFDPSLGYRDAVDDVLSVAGSRGFPPPNVDLGLGAMSFCARMPPESGQAVATLGKVAGWLAHALEEYGDPTLFRARGYYVGSRPEPPERPPAIG